MQEITIVYMEDPFEAEGVFKDGNLIAAWSMNDANWRDEYFNGFMNQLGIKVKRKTPTNNDKRAISAYFGEDPDNSEEVSLNPR